MKDLYKTAPEIPADHHIRMQATFQKHVDNAVSKTVNLPEDASVEEIGRIYRLARSLGCKGVTVYRYNSRKDQVLLRGCTVCGDNFPEPVPKREYIMVEFKLESPDVHDKKREELYAKVIALKDIVSYQDGTVASRMLVNKKAGTITVFSFDENEGLSEHTAPYDAVVTIIDGECEVWVAGKTLAMKEGQTIVFPANVPHALSAVTKFKMTLTMIRE